MVRGSSGGKGNGTSKDTRNAGRMDESGEGANQAAESTAPTSTSAARMIQWRLRNDREENSDSSSMAFPPTPEQQPRN